MKLSWRNLMTGLGTVLLLTACGGGGGDDDGSSQPVANKPAAVATAGQTSVPIGTPVTLDGSGSTTPNGGTITYQWSLPGKPDGSTAELTNSTDVESAFTPDRPGEYVAALIVNDGTASSDSARVTITATNPEPVAVITPESQGVLLGATITLDGSVSLPPTGVNASELVYQWTLTERPDGDNAELHQAETAKASFQASQVGIYRAKLKVSHGERSSEAETTITVNASNSAPVMSLNVPASAVRGETVVLDGSASHDADGDFLSYRWSFPSAIGNSTLPAIPYGSSASIRNANSAKAEFVPDAAGTYHIDFTIYDASVAITQRVTIKVDKPEGAPNTPPVAVIGTGNALEYELGGYVTPGGGRSYDIDGDALTYQWTWWNTATPGDKQTTTSQILNLGRNLPGGTYQAELVVNDGQEDSVKVSQTFEIKIGANVAPVVGTSLDIARVLVGGTLVFDGRGSSDRNTDPLGYQWTLIDRPDGSNAVLQNATSERASVVTDRPGVYTARLRVSDPKGAINATTPSDTLSGFAKAKNNPPVVTNPRINNALKGGFSAVESQPGQPLALSSNGSVSLDVSFLPFDPDLDAPLYVMLSATKQPSGSEISSATLTTASGYPTTTLPGTGFATASVPGDYELELLISDGPEIAEQRIAVTVVERASYPTLLLEGNVRSDVPSSSDYQQFFPYVARGLEQPSDIDLSTDDSIFANASYRLTAFDRDYTITDLMTSASEDSLTPAFVGLVDGQVIRKGDSVRFRLNRPNFPDEVRRVREIYDTLNGDAREQALEQIRKELDSYAFTWSFRLVERDGYTFYYGPRQ